ncbi:hypothetical protein BB561_003106 [Smittium simulii]|uniref:BTB domain-containing protein n=1 Tax=Smittium simulii TaxID=133385 RepID=A0A2T9YMX2_9FUNG|nr:hypothetical protein BB561_003106 [Smittium simulii]
MDLEKYISDIKKYKKLNAYKDKYEILPEIHNCAGNPPPPLMGASTTFINGRVYLFGGKHINSSTINTEIYIFYLESKKWKQVNNYLNNQFLYNEAQRVNRVKALDQESLAKNALRRYFHSAVAFKKFIVFFGGISIPQTEPDMKKSHQLKPYLSTSSKIFSIKGKSLPVFKMIMNSQSSLASRKSISKNLPAKRLLLNDIIVFDTEYNVWVDVKNIITPKLYTNEKFSNTSKSLNNTISRNSNESSNNQSPIKLEVMLPQPRYAHLSCLINQDKMIVIGGQGLAEEYIKEFNVYDFSTHKWVCKKILDIDISCYCSAVASLPNETALLYSNYLHSPKNKVVMFTINASNNFTFDQSNLKKEFNVPIFVFPSMNIINSNCIFFAGVLSDLNGHQKLSVWSYNPLTQVSKEIFSSSDSLKGLWKNPIVSSTTQHFIMFGDSKKKLDKEHRFLHNSFTQCMEISLTILGLSRLNVIRSDTTLCEFNYSETENVDMELCALSKSMQKCSDILESVQNLGFLALSINQLNDIWLETTDGKIIPINSTLLETRAKAICNSWRIGKSIENESRKNTGSYSYINNDSIIQINEINKGMVQKKTSTSQLINLKNSIKVDRFLVPEASEVVIPLVKFLYSGVLEIAPILSNAQTNTQVDFAKRRVITILSRLIFIGQNTDLPELRSAAVLLLHQQINSDTALYILDTVHKLKLPEIEALCLRVIRNSFNYKSLQESYVWNNISESTRYFVESKIINI